MQPPASRRCPAGPLEGAEGAGGPRADRRAGDPGGRGDHGACRPGLPQPRHHPAGATPGRPPAGRLLPARHPPHRQHEPLSGAGSAPGRPDRPAQGRSGHQRLARGPGTGRPGRTAPPGAADRPPQRGGAAHAGEQPSGPRSAAPLGRALATALAPARGGDAESATPAHQHPARCGDGAGGRPQLARRALLRSGAAHRQRHLLPGEHAPGRAGRPAAAAGAGGRQPRTAGGRLLRHRHLQPAPGPGRLAGARAGAQPRGRASGGSQRGGERPRRGGQLRGGGGGHAAAVLAAPLPGAVPRSAPPGPRWGGPGGPAGVPPPLLLYLSCDPATLARDLGQLCRSCGYGVSTVQPLDFFPQTSHVETLAVLRRHGG
ncbi:protein of unknown function [Cyanobium sp. NIES-981]|nr:protein of unknown function [Cyanobium sp. NIES-981]